ncbi:autotransporter outer membrane beta-barrel domain-containing protein [Thiomicrospira sp. XS5]|uniref:autotransporter outer membrane beta-barrel domain-containing protein n=1 Tax=Thiomicrospira sp. XS5 TaxID=1775636 RepID=UPI000A4958FC|nr:autotransporter outer membrane beta-barrel domain-containing protein [Thiomicrospira sp. XS5]
MNKNKCRVAVRILYTKGLGWLVNQRPEDARKSLLVPLNSSPLSRRPYSYFKSHLNVSLCMNNCSQSRTMRIISVFLPVVLFSALMLLSSQPARAQGIYNDCPSIPTSSGDSASCTIPTDATSTGADVHTSAITSNNSASVVNYELTSNQIQAMQFLVNDEQSNGLRVDASGADGNSDELAAGWGGNVTINNNTSLEANRDTNAPLTNSNNAIHGIRAQASGGDGAQPDGHGSGGRGGNGGNVAITNTAEINITGAASTATQTPVSAAAIAALSFGGDGGEENDGSGDQVGGNGGDSFLVTITNGGEILLGSSADPFKGKGFGWGIAARSNGGNAGYDAAAGGHGAKVNVDSNATININWSGQDDASDGVRGIFAESLGGNGSESENKGDPGGKGEAGQEININVTEDIHIDTNEGQTVTANANSPSAIIYAVSQGGNGGIGPDNAKGGVSGGNGGGASTTNSGDNSGVLSVTISNEATLSASGDHVLGVVAQSFGGNGGAGNDDKGGDGGDGGFGGQIQLNLKDSSSIMTDGDFGYAVLSQSVGGLGGDGGSNGGDAGTGADAGGVGLYSTAGTTIQTTGDFAAGVTLHSVGGGGGTGGNFTGVLAGSGGNGGNGGNGDKVTITSGSTVTTAGEQAYGLLVQSIGGSGGTGGIGTGLVLGLGGDGGAGGAAGEVEVNNTGAVTTSGYGSTGIVAQSISGGGGTAGTTGGVLSIGGQGGATHDGAMAYVTNNNDINVTGDAAYGIQVQSIGGGGGSASGTAGVVAIGGSGSAGGDGGTAEVFHVGGTVSTAGEFGHGIFAQSIGGGGGSGGNVMDLSVGVGVGVGGSASGGGDGGIACATNVYGNCPTAISDQGSEALQDNHSSVATNGDFAIGVLVQSIGGGGGSGGNAVSAGAVDITSVTLGGQAGGGGDAGSANAYFDEMSLTTTGANALGLTVQSIGGGGGNGGNATSFNAEGIVPIQVGGTGGSGGNGYATDSSGNILPLSLRLVSSDVTTLGSHAYGVLAQAVGGGGGTGGAASGYDASIGFDFNTSVGGAGSKGGTGGQPDVILSDTEVVTSGSVATNGNFTPDYSAVDAHGVVAQSIGGGGGNGGQSVADALTVAVPTGEDVSVDASVTTSVGGAAGTGGGGSIVNVALNGTSSITTGGDGAMGIIAQSIGGGGGNGGSADALSATVGDIDSVSVGVTSALGAKGSAGGSGGLVTVQLQDQATVTTFGDHANAILAQSIGGGGGNGGLGSVANDQIGGGLDVQATIGLGGSGGSGGFANKVTVATNSGSTITTNGSGARGIVAQSIAGGGGTSQGGTIGLSASESIAGDEGSNEEMKDSNEEEESQLSASVQISVGKTGGSSEPGGDLNITNSGTISTSGGDADGLLAQSIGGSGGLAGSAGNDSGSEDSDNDGFSGDDEDTSYSLNLAVGGTGGTGSNGGTITLTHAGKIITDGDHADGLLAQTIGGGGGAGGTAVAAGSEATAALNLGVGGTGGAGGNGGDINITFDDNEGNSIKTSGYMAHGALIQSIGGGGGQAADGSEHSSGKLTIGGGLGGTGGASGNGGAITLTSSSWLNTSTTGDNANGVVLQSIGGGGGIGGVGTKDSESEDINIAIQVGGAGGASGDGGTITLSDIGFDLSTNGSQAHGLIAQSIGGGGGIGSVGSGDGTVQLGGGNGASGAGGTVRVELTETAGSNKSSITTKGDGAHAVIAQSIGGGGGIAGDISGAINSGSIDNQNTDVGGSGGQVTVSVDALINTSGSGAHGIIAQSIGGGGGLIKGTSGLLAGSLLPDVDADANDVFVTQAGTLTTSGVNSVGIFAQSLAPSTSGTINVTVNGAITGGTGDNGAGVWIADGSDFDGSNTLTVNGSVAAGDNDADAVRYSAVFGSKAGALLNVINNGTINGNIVLTNADGGQAGTITNNGNIVNNSRAQNLASTTKVGLLTGATLYDADLVNAGRIEVGRAKPGDTTIITGDLIQTSNGTTIAQTDFANKKSDRLIVEGSAALAGSLNIDATSLAPTKVKVLSVQGDISGTLTAEKTPAVTYGLSQANRAFTVEPDTHFGQAFPTLNSHEQAIGDHLDSIFDAGATPYATELARLNTLSKKDDNGKSYARALSSLSPGASLAAAAASANLTFGHLDKAMDCSSLSEDSRESECTWVEVGSSSINQDGELGYDGTITGLKAGGQIELRPNWFFGVALGYGTASFDADHDQSSSNGEIGFATLSLKRHVGSWIMAGAVSGSIGSYDIQRKLSFPDTKATANSDVYDISGRFRIAYSISADPVYIRPSIDLDIIHTRSGGYNERDAGIYNLSVAPAQQTAFIGTPTLEIGSQFELSEGRTLRAFVRGGISMSSQDSWTTSARFSSAPDGVQDFETKIPIAQTVGRMNLGLQLFSTEGLDLRAEYEGGFGDDFETHAGMLRLIKKF